MRTVLTANTIMLGLGQLWFSKYLDSETHIGCAMFILEDKGIFLSAGFSQHLLAELMFGGKDKNKGYSLVIPQTLDAQESTVRITSAEAPVDWKKILEDFTSENKAQLLRGGMFFSFSEQGKTFWNVEDGGVSVDMTAMLNSLGGMVKLTDTTLGEDENWEEWLANFMMKFNKIMNPDPDKIEIMKKKGGYLFVAQDALSVNTFTEMYLN